MCNTTTVYLHYHNYQYIHDFASSSDTDFFVGHDWGNNGAAIDYTAQGIYSTWYYPTGVPVISGMHDCSTLAKHADYHLTVQTPTATVHYVEIGGDATDGAIVEAPNPHKGIFMNALPDKELEFLGIFEAAMHSTEHA